jgi:glycosyltransferase involved in cell wall biosynthesis
VLTLVDGIGTYGGGESLAREIVQRLDPERFERAFCVSRWDPATASDPPVERALGELEEAGVEFIGLERFGRPALRPWGALVSRLRREPIDILHTHKFGSNAWGALLAPAARVPVFIAHEHTWSFQGRPVRKLADRLLIGRVADVVVAVSREDRRRMIEIEGLDPEKVLFIPNGIPDPPAAAEAAGGEAIRRELGIEPGAPVLGTVATLRPQKALDVLIRATALLAGARPSLQVLIAGGDVAGDPAMRNQLEALARELGVEQNVRLLGLRTDVPAIIDALDIAVCSSDFEGSPLSVMEYMAGAKPVVATSVGGVPDLIADGENGLLVPPQDPQGLAAAVAELLADPQRARRMGEAGRTRRREEFSIDATVRHIEDLYDELLQPRAEAPAHA